MAGFTAKEQNFIIFNSEKKLVIPFFQRKYVWKKENWDELYDNFFVKEEPGFLGSILVQRNSIDAGSNKLDVIDGQQRLTTLSILVMAIYDSIENKDKVNAEDEMLNALFSKDTFSKNYEPKLSHSKFDKEDFETVISLNKVEKIYKDENDCIISKGIKGCYNRFMERLKKETDEKKEKVLADFLEGKYLIWVVITLDKDMDEQSIFDTLNNSGVSLTAADTIKNYIFKKAEELYDNKYGNEIEARAQAITELYTSNWEEVFQKDEDTEEYWNSEVITGRIRRSKLDLFLYCYGAIAGFFSQYDNNISDLTKVYKKHLEENIKSVDDINSFLIELKNNAKIFKDNFNNSSKETSYKYSKENVLQRLLHLLKINDVTTFHPLILKILKENENNNDIINTKLHMLEKYLIINYLNEDSSKIKNYNKMCVTMLNDENKLKEEVKEVSDNITFTLINHIPNGIATYFLFWIELYRRSNEKNDEVSLNYVYSLEHIMPKKWKEHWFADVGKGLKNSAGEVLSVPDSIDYRDNHICMIGNMTLLKSKLNTSISNGDFETKLKKIKEFASLKITKDDIVEKFTKTDNEKKIKWDEEDIESRTKALKEEIKAALLY